MHSLRGDEARGRISPLCAGRLFRRRGPTGRTAQRGAGGTRPLAPPVRRPGVEAARECGPRSCRDRGPSSLCCSGPLSAKPCGLLWPAFFLDDPSLFPLASDVLQQAREWVALGLAEARSGYFTAAEEPPEPSPGPKRGRPKRHTVATLAQHARAYGGHCKATGIAHVSPGSRQQLPGAGPCCRGTAWTSDAVLGSSPRRALCPSGFDASSVPKPFTAHRPASGSAAGSEETLPRPRQGAAACRYHWRRRRRAARGDASCLRHPCTEPSPDDPCQPARPERCGPLLRCPGFFDFSAWGFGSPEASGGAPFQPGQLREEGAGECPAEDGPLA